ncbi:gamma carbonic anhydrase family protein [Actinokineospora globicatena]|uniref:Gamma carbonic anhydrase family protein n=1 Tax=Actinokineospora globicatena TaxID=103729 RepID=A0A9W6QVV0_9PSEU|nr:gamma carbonic anhydrase family protein [Actinokineospora globicatena]GLW95549.1 gamma carbonic anhydrase family protein [Actinokineospora globicatena]
MPLYSFEGKSPKVDPSAWIAPTATLIGDVTVEADASVWYGAVIRADFGPVVIGAGANVQDNTVIHVNANGCQVGANATIGHLCVVHDCVIGAQALIGNGATIQDGAVIGERALVAAGALVGPGTQIPPEVVAMGVPAKRQVPLEGTPKVWVDHNAAIYQDLARRHAKGIEEV